MPQIAIQAAAIVIQGAKVATDALQGSYGLVPRLFAQAALNVAGNAVAGALTRPIAAEGAWVAEPQA